MTHPQSDDRATAPAAPDWSASPRWRGIVRSYSPADVARVRGTLHIEHSLARHGAEKLWRLLHENDYVHALGAVTGNQAMQMARAGLPAVYVSGWQAAADANEAGHMYPDESLYPSNSVPKLVRRINNTLRRCDEIDHAEGRSEIDWYLPLVADAEAGFGGVLNCFELTKAMIEAGVAGVHFEDQLGSAKKCGHMGGRVLVPTAEAIRKLQAARLAADVCDVPTVLIARTDADGAHLVTSDIDARDRPFLTGERTIEGHFRMRGGIDAAVARAIAYAPYADLVWCETHTPDLAHARLFAEAVLAAHPGKMLAYNCSPSFHWTQHLGEADIARFQRELGAMGYRFQFVTLAGFHTLNLAMFELARAYWRTDMQAYVAVQEREFAAQADGYTAVRHQHEVGTGYFDTIGELIEGRASETRATHGSTEEEQFDEVVSLPV